MVLELPTHNRRMDMLGNWSVGDREEPPSYQISRRPISRIVIPTFIAEMALSRNFSGISKKALYSVPSFFWSLNFILFFACWSFARCGRHHLSRSSQRRRRYRRKFGQPILASLYQKGAQGLFFSLITFGRCVASVSNTKFLYH